ncbi:MAG: KEOPS complex subunit Pcc1, partial [Methanobrevibacter sp.]|nr:KEOPS complex subunit Pcc1 [Methanobrevibacter sp.]
KKCEKMKINGILTLNYKTEDNASLIYNSLEVDNGNYVKSKINKNTINYEINSDSLGSFLATVDDLIASEIVCEKIINKTNDL